MKLYKVEDLKNSAIFFNKKTPKFISVGILLICLMCIVFMITLSMTIKNYIIEGSGVVTTDKSVYLISHTNGNVQEINKKEGVKVKKGEVILTLTDGLQHEDIKNLILLKEQTEKKLKDVELFNSSLEAKKNLLNYNDVLQKEYYTKMEYYLRILKDEIASKNSQRDLINKRKDKVDDLSQKLLIAKDETEKENINNQINTINEEIINLENNLSLSIGQSDQIYYQLKIDNDVKRDDLNKQLMDINGKIDELNDIKNLLEIKATSDGYVHYLTEIKVGVPIIQNQTIGSIYPIKGDMIVEGFIPAKDITKIAINDECRIEIVGVNHNQFERIKGKIIAIDNGAVTKDEKGIYSEFYKVLIKIDKTEIKDSRNNQITIKPTLPVNIKVIYAKESYLEWLLNILDFNN